MPDQRSVTPVPKPRQTSMVRRCAALLIASAGIVTWSGCAPLQQPPTPTQRPPSARTHYTKVDTLPAFWRFWKAAEGKDPYQQITLFREIVAAAHPEIYTKGVIGRTAGTKAFSLDARLGEWLPQLPARIATMRRLTREIEANLERFDHSFKRAFPDFTWRGTVYFTVAVDAFDGAVRKVDGEMALLFGIDKIAKLHGADASLEPLFHHELFHMHHSAVNPSPVGDRTLLYPLWNEGLAVYVAHKLNPKATWPQLVLSDAMVRQGTELLPRLAAELRPHLKGTTEADYRDFFLGAGKRADIPRRVGYFVGYQVVKLVARDKTLDQLVRLRGKKLFVAVDEALKTLAVRRGPLTRTLAAPALSRGVLATTGVETRLPALSRGVLATTGIETALSRGVLATTGVAARLPALSRGVLATTGVAARLPALSRRVLATTRVAAP